MDGNLERLPATTERPQDLNSGLYVGESFAPILYLEHLPKKQSQNGVQ